MTDLTPLADCSGSVEVDVVPCPERRQAPRIDCHTVVTAVARAKTAEGEQLQVLKAHSQDVSVGGAKLISQEALPCKRLFLRFLLPTFGDRYVEAEVVNESRKSRKSLKGQSTLLYVYGVRFTGVMSHGEVMDEIMPSPAGTPLHDHEAVRV